jgi:hypothetical protein
MDTKRVHLWQSILKVRRAGWAYYLEKNYKMVDEMQILLWDRLQRYEGWLP